MLKKKKKKKKMQVTNNRPDASETRGCRDSVHSPYAPTHFHAYHLDIVHSTHALTNFHAYHLDIVHSTHALTHFHAYHLDVVHSTHAPIHFHACHNPTHTPSTAFRKDVVNHGWSLNPKLQTPRLSYILKCPTPSPPAEMKGPFVENPELSKGSLP